MNLSMPGLLLLVGGSIVYWVCHYALSLRHNIAEAKRSGLPYVVVPCSPITHLWRISFPLCSRLLKLLPKSWWEDWFDVMIPDNIYWSGWKLFERYGEAFLVVSPGFRVLYVANAEMITQIFAKREQFPKWVARYHILRLFGENLITAEGQTWRLHRRVIAASFSERNAALVFREAIVQAQGMVRGWIGPSETRSEVLRTVERDALRMALHIIGYVGFGLRLLWPGQTLPANMDPKYSKYSSLEAAEGYEMSFVDTMRSVMDNILLIPLAPKWLLRAWPSERTTEALVAYENYTKYMEEMMEDKLDDARRGIPPEGMDLMGSLVRCAYEADAAKDDKTGKAASLPVLTREEIIGNAFIMFAAGHETSGGNIHVLMMLLATNPSAQRHLQRGIDQVLGDSDPSTWDYDTKVSAMMGSMIGACLYETLRIVPPAVEIPKEVSPLGDQPVTMDGREYLLTEGTGIAIVTSGVHLNPRYWPHADSKICEGGNDLRDFRPERWFPNKSGLGARGVEDTSGPESAAQYGGHGEVDSSAQMFRPAKGSYIPFSDGSRSCMGRRTAQAQITAMLAVVFREYSVELAVDEWASDAEVQAMSRDERASVYRQAQDKSRQTMMKMYSVVTLGLHSTYHVPLRLVKRGHENFVDWMDG
ncbi:hypothetical protein JDV02_002224 [Purpureocillium takamizusanense]|uniref:Cytochrome P450 n=1 Tax=Purpureocillium takamizusanense TaxID=2060973 RepID=A0A9Q8QAM7_9HYPO|nr:uncharacterized protein JDV02_002224 [Purpureocillium takamizusanense]UNI15718.1 hypothetical protein JDV02_002224 [Purpureocillium takamizusanense]